jgi:hypothetical protein
MTRHQFGEGLLMVGSLGLLVGAFVAIERHTRAQGVSLVDSSPFNSLGGGVSWLNSLASALIDTVRYQSIEHAPLTVFFAVAMVLLLFMMRT